MNSMVDALGPGNGGLLKAVLKAADGAQADIYLHGGHVTSWIPAGGDERLFLSRMSEFSSTSSIRGGVPIIFPQFAAEGPLPRHGFARRMNWELVRVEDNCAELCLRDNEATRAIWPVNFLANLVVTIGGAVLKMEFAVTNTGNQPLNFTGALHTYLRVTNIDRVILEGLADMTYQDNVLGRQKFVQMERDLRIQGEMERLYFDVKQPLILSEPPHALSIKMKGFKDVMVWNPGAERSAALPDMLPDDYRHMLCVEAAQVSKAVELAPGETWHAAQILEA